MTSFGGYSRSKILGIVRRAKGPEQSIWLIPRTHQGPQDSGKARERLFSFAKKKKSSTKKYLYLDRTIGDNNTFFNFSAMDWSLPYRQPFFIPNCRSNVPRNQEFSPGYRIKISEKTVTHDNAFFNAFLVK